MSTSPQHLGKYELQQRLGQGGMAEVWKAFDSQLQRYVAIKLLHMNLQADPDFVARFQREAQLIASLHHPNIMQIHDFQVASPPETESPIAYMVMDYVEGQTLADYIRSTSARGQIPSPADIVNLFTSLSLAVDYAHQKGMIHRDIKPANILLDKRTTTFNSMGEPILTDFGVAKLLGMSTSALSGAQLGTPLYISPEQAQGLPGDERSDLYSLGVILYEMVTGVTPFQGDTPVAVMTQHISTMPSSPALINPRIPPALTSVILQSLAKDPNARFPNAAAMTVALAHALNIPVPERLGSPTDRLNPRDTPTLFSPLPPGQQSSGKIPAGSTSGGPTLADSSKNLPIVTPAQPYPVATSGGQVPPGQVPLPAPQTGPQYAASAAFAQSAPNYAPQAATPSPPPLASLAPSLVPQPPSAPGRRLSRLYIVFAVLLLVVMIGAGFGAYSLLVHTNLSPPNPVVGHAFYVSSGQLADGAQGIADQLQIDLQNVQPPSGKSYYLWLLADKDTTPKPDLLGPSPLALVHPPILLTNNLPVRPDGTIHYMYMGDAQHNNLLSATSRLLITLEDAGRTPASPSTDRSTWIYYAELPQTYIPKDPTGLRGLDHIRHIYYNEDHLEVAALYGGLDIWVFRNTAKLLEWSTSARDDFDGTTTHYVQMHDLFTSILDYLDGTPNVHVDVPPGTPVTADPNIAKISLLTVDPTRQGVAQYLRTDPPGDLDHLLLHLSQLNRALDATPEIHQLSQEIIVAITNAEQWLTLARADAKKLFDMTPEQLAQSTAASLLDDLVTQVTYAYIGQLDPNTNTVKPGVLQAHYDAQKLATFDITRNVPQSL